MASFYDIQKGVKALSIDNSGIVCDSRMQSFLFYSVPVLAAFLAARWIKRKRHQRILEDSVKRRQNERIKNFEVIRKFSSVLASDTAAEIASWSYDQLKERLREGQLSCDDALRAYQQRALYADEKTNCICLFIEEAIVWANELDKKAADPNYVKPPMFGIPVSIKECIKVKNYDSTLGYAQDLHHPAKEHSAVVAQLIHLGAIPFVHTNIPLSLCAYGCTNTVYGRTTHPQNATRVPGGSSGGEAALISLGASTLGIGSDIGGSIRIPSTYCGISGFKPSVSRFSHTGMAGGIPGRKAVIANEGPMASEISTCVDYLKNVWSDDFLFKRDPFVPPVYWQEDLYSSKEPLTIGYYKFDGFIKAAPAYERVVKECVDYLKSQGHHLVEFKVPDALKAVKLCMAAITADGGIFLNNKMNNDLIPSDMNFGFVAKSLSTRVQRFLGKMLPWPRLSSLLHTMPINCTEMRQIYADIDAYRSDFVNRVAEKKIDVLLCPPMALYPPQHEFPAKYLFLVSYTSLFNLLDFPAGTVPISHVTEEDDALLDNYPKNDPVDMAIRRACKGCIGLPIGIQVAAAPYREEIALRVLSQLSKLGG